MSLASEIITTFEVIVDDVTELSTTEELALLNRVYFRACTERPWEFLKTENSGTLSGSGSDGFFITIPTDFSNFIEDDEWTDNTISTQLNSSPKVIFMGTDLAPYKIVNFSDRRKYLGDAGYAYLDLANDKIVFTGIPVSTTYTFDYIKVPAILTASDTPVIPTRFQDLLAYGMAAENDVIQISPKAKSYKDDNMAMYNAYIIDMAFWNANLILN